MSIAALPQVQPLDEHNRTLLDNVHPADWRNPSPRDIYNLVVIGAGTGGLVSAAVAAGLGARVALVERHLMGGDCLNTGCVPSKCLIRSARMAADAANADAFGIRLDSPPEVDFASVMERMRRLRAGISSHDATRRFAEDYGVDVFLGNARFIDREHVDVDGDRLRFKKAVIATGGRPRTLNIPGLQEAGFHTSESIFSLTERPRHLLVVGGGPIGCELAQTFRRLGCEVTLLQRSAQLLPREDRDAAELVATRFREEGVRVCLGTEMERVETREDQKTVKLKSGGNLLDDPLTCDHILLAVGRVPNTEDLDLEQAGVAYDRHGVQVTDRLQTTNKRVYAVGDCCMTYQFTHAADAAARLVVQNALFAGRKRLSDVTIPWCTYTDPEIAHVGLSERQAREAGVPIDTYGRPLEDVDRAVADGQTDGFVRIYTKQGTGRIVGAVVVAAHAGEMISEISTAMKAGLSVGKLSAVIHPYPTQAEAIRHIGDMYNRTRLTPFLKKLFEVWLRWQRRL